MPVLIEFFSVPGGGKTTLAGLLAGRRPLHTRTDLSAAWKAQSFAAKLGQISGSFLDMRCNAAALRFVVQGKLWTAASIFRLGRLMAKRNWVATRSDNIVLDQGFLQDLWSILYSARRSQPDQPTLSALVACLYKGVQPRIVFLQIDPQCAAQRIATRKHGDSRLDGLSQKEASELLATNWAIPKAIIRAAESAGLRVDRMDASLPMEVLVEKIRHFD